MEHRKLGEQGLEVAAIGIGTMGMTMAYGQGGDEASHFGNERGLSAGRARRAPHPGAPSAMKARCPKGPT